MVWRVVWKNPSGLSSDGSGRRENPLSRYAASLKSALKMSSRSPSTPSPSQWRTTSSMAFFTAGLR